MNSLVLQNLVLKTRSFEMATEFREIKFQQNLQVKFKKDEKVMKGRIFVDQWLHSNIDDIAIDKLFDKHYKLSNLDT